VPPGVDLLRGAQRAPDGRMARRRQRRRRRARVLVAIAVLGAVAVTAGAVALASAVTHSVESATRRSAGASAAPSPTVTVTVPTAAPSASPSRSASPRATVRVTPRPTPPRRPQTPAPPPLRPSAPVLVLNNSTIQGLAARSAERVRNVGFTVRDVGNLRGRYESTTIYYRAGYADQAWLLAGRLRGMQDVAPAPAGLPGSTALTLVVTQDFTAG
jgi:hypothetical protein